MRGGGSHKLNDKVRAFIVTRFAMSMTPTQVMAAVKEEFGVEITKQMASRYNPLCKNGANQMAAKWKRLYAEVREKFLDELAAIPIANRAVRMQQLQLHYETAVARNNLPLATSILEQAAKEAGGFLTNERNVKHSGRVSVEPEMTEEEKRAYLADRLAEAWEKARERAGPAPTHH